VSRPFVLRITPIGAATSSYLTIDDALLTIGRAKDNHVVLDHVSVAPKHARLARSAVGIDVEVVGISTVLVDGKRIPKSARIHDGHVVTIGQYTIELSDRDAPTDQERVFIDAIALTPKDDSCRAVYGDWLEENGRSAEAEFLRAQLAIKSLSAEDPRFQQLSDRIRELAPSVSLSWRRTIARPALENCGNMQYQVQCPKQWDELLPTATPQERYCGSCRRNVHYATTLDDARTLAAAGECLVVDLVERRTPNDLRRGPPPIAEFTRPALPGMYLPPTMEPPKK